ncbi:MAG: caspase family protein [Candidatus Aegiribacteria sp.]|nr:caspase family protein [Candidatus Aegiribacteria sp.]
MFSVLLSSAILSVVLPVSTEIETISSGQQAIIDLSSGEGWVRILEDDYVCLRVSVSDGIQMKAFDENGNILCQSDSGSDMILSAFADYWFYIHLESTSSANSIVLAVEEVTSSELSPGRDAESVLGRNVMAETYTFSPDYRGRWTFRLDGTGGTDLDLEVYGTNMSSWGSSMSLEGFETVTVSVLPGEVVTAVVSRYGKSGSGEYSLSIEPSGQFPLFDSSGLAESITAGEIHRYLIPEHGSSFFLDLAILSPGADIDLVLRDASGERLMASQSYYSIEALMLEPAGNVTVADVILFDPGENESVSYEMYTREPGSISNLIPVKEVINIGSECNRPVGFAPDHGGLFRVSVNFEKMRDGDVRVFRGAGEPAITFASARGDEEFLLYVSAKDTVWIDPHFANIETLGEAIVRIARSDAMELEGEYSGVINGDSPVKLFTVSAEPETILDIELSAEDREVDLDLFVTGPDFDLVAEGWLSNVDAAGDEAVEVYAEDSAEYGITVYLYERSGQTPFVLEVNKIERTVLAEPSPEPEIWAISAGISGYSSTADVLNRASMDAVEMYDFLIEEQGVPADHAILLVDAMATSEEFVSGISALLNSAGPEDKVVVFFSGHGDQSYPGSGGDEEPDSANESICLYDDDISDDRIASLVDSLSVSPVFLFLDACHSGGFVNDFTDGSNVLILTAAREDLSVSERILTPILLQGSRGDADSNGNGYVSALELITYIDEKLRLICPECDAELTENTYICPECGAVLKGDNAVPRPQQGMFLVEDVELWKIR